MNTAQGRAARRATPLQRLASSLAEHTIWPLALVVAVTVVTERALPLALVVAAALLAARWLALGAPAVRTSADWPVIALAALGLLSLAVTARMDLTAPQVGRLLLGVALFYGVAGWATTPARLGLLSLGFACAGLVLALGALVGVDWAQAGSKLALLPVGLIGRLQRSVGDGVNPNVMAGYLALLLPIVAGPALFGWRKLGFAGRALHVGTTLLMLVVLVLTQSRAGLLAVSVGALALAALRWRAALIGAVALGLAGAASLALGAGPALAAALAANVALGGLAERQEIWSRAGYIVRDFFFTGVGMGSFAHVVGRFYPLVLAPPDAPHAHNLFLQVAVDLGVPGLMAYLTALALVVTTAWRALGRAKAGANWDLAGLAAGLLAAQVALATHGLLDAVTWGMVRPAVLVWATWGAAMAVGRVMCASEP